MFRWPRRALPPPKPTGLVSTILNTSCSPTMARFTFRSVINDVKSHWHRGNKLESPSFGSQKSGCELKLVVFFKLNIDGHDILAVVPQFSTRTQCTTYWIKFSSVKANGQYVEIEAKEHLVGELTIYELARSDLSCDNTQAQLQDDKLTFDWTVAAFIDDKTLERSNKAQVEQNNSACLVEDLEDTFKDEKFSDVTLRAGGKDFKVHKVILAAKSRVFRAMFLAEMEECEQNCFELENVEPEVLEEMLRFMYTGRLSSKYKLTVEEEEETEADEGHSKPTTSALFQAADKYLLDDLKEICENILGDNITVESAAEILSLADKHGASRLFEKAMNILLVNASEIVETDAWKGLVKDRPELVAKIFIKHLSFMQSVHGKFQKGATKLQS